MCGTRCWGLQGPEEPSINRLRFPANLTVVNFMPWKAGIDLLLAYGDAHHRSLDIDGLNHRALGSGEAT